jgi:hypothetical protein
MSRITLDSSYQGELQRRIAEVARNVVEERTGIAEAARVITGLAFELGADADEVFGVVRGVEAETEAFPLGGARDRWSAAALAREDAARSGYESRVRGRMMESCAKLIHRFGGGEGSPVRVSSGLTNRITGSSGGSATGTPARDQFVRQSRGARMAGIGRVRAMDYKGGMVG